MTATAVIEVVSPPHADDSHVTLVVRTADANRLPVIALRVNKCDLSRVAYGERHGPTVHADVVQVP